MVLMIKITSTKLSRMAIKYSKLTLKKKNNNNNNNNTVRYILYIIYYRRCRAVAIVTPRRRIY